ncbi:hypothetical protein WN943_023251 [Citrus x changshan-huyou]
MRQVELVISFQGIKKNSGLLQPAYTLAKIKNALDVNALTVEVTPVLYPQFQDSALLQALFTNLGVVLPDELINQLNDSIRENASVGKKLLMGDNLLLGKLLLRNRLLLGADEYDEDALQSDCLNRNDCNDDDINAEVMQVEIDGTVKTTLVDEDNEGTTETKVDSDSDGSLSYDNKEVKGIIDSSNDDIELETVKLTNYIQQHEYKLSTDGKNKLKLGHMFRDIAHFREILHEVATKIKSQVIVDPNVKINLLKNFKKETYGLKIKNMTLYRATANARIKVFGDHLKGYQKLFKYVAAIHKTDPGAICKVLCDAVSILDKVLFQRFFVSFSVQRNAFPNSCRHFIGVDGCHLKGKYSGVLLATVGMDGNNGIVPLAICVYKIENTETWEWFMEHLHSYIDDERQLKQLFRKATKSCNKHDFDEGMAEIKAVKEAVFEWLKR